MDVSESRSPLASRHPWELSRCEFFERVLKHHGLLTPQARILDVGAGDGWFSAQLVVPGSLEGSIVCWDTAYDPAQKSLSTHPSLKPVVQRPSERFDLLLLLDVLEHVPQDNEFLQSLVQDNVKPGGYVLVSVPCWSWLFSGHDRRLHHVRRYTPAGCRQVIESKGLKILQSGGLFHSLLPVRAVLAGMEHVFKREKPHDHIGEAAFSAPVHAALMAMLRMDTLISWTFARGGLNVPGLSWWALCQKR